MPALALVSTPATRRSAPVAQTRGHRCSSARSGGAGGALCASVAEPVIVGSGVACGRARVAGVALDAYAATLGEAGRTAMAGEIETFRGVAHPWLCDVFERLSTRHQMAMFDDAGFHLLHAIAPDAATLAAERTGWADVRLKVDLIRAES